MLFKKFHEEWLSKPRIVCGIMSGTSLDGIDVAIAEFSNDNGNHSFKTLAYQTVPFLKDFRQQVLDIIEHEAPVANVSRMHYLLPKLYADAVRTVCNDAGFKTSDIDAVGVHGQTVWHAPQDEVASTLQLGSVSARAQELRIPVVGDFRAADVALGGQGAPLVPIFDFAFLKDDSRNIIALNIGGISNITLLPKNCTEENVIAFDTGPGNVWIDGAMKQYFGKNYDENGNFAREGRTLPRLLAALKELDYIQKLPPKSTGRELFTPEVLEKFLKDYASPHSPGEDIVRTLTEFTSWSIAENIRLFGKTDSRLIISGGGVHNSVLLELLKAELPEAEVLKSDEIGLSSDAKEAICFGYLAYRTLGGLPGSLQAVTGALRASILGAVAFP
ncbi:MAG: anhydro-N-acetylmuramic acid kinase [Bacteroidota bacterium]